MRNYLHLSAVFVFALAIAASCGVDPSAQAGDSSAADAGDVSVTPVEEAAQALAPSPAAEQPLVEDEPQVEAEQQPALEDDAACPLDMVLVQGDFCLEPEQKCVEWMEDPVQFPFARCSVFQEPSTCESDLVPMKFCIDRLEAADPSGMPFGDVSWNEAKAACESDGKRLCQQQEWVFACEGEEARPYPYGYVRNSATCNFEKKDGLVTDKGVLADHRQPAASNPECLSPFGVQNMVGNIDEWVVLDRPHYSQRNGGRKMMSGLKGGWWGPLRNRCRPVTVDHDEVFHGLQTGYRCCADATASAVEQAREIEGAGE